MAASSQKLELLRLSLDDRIDELPAGSPLIAELKEELEAANGDCVHRLSLPNIQQQNTHYANRLARPAALTGVSMFLGLLQLYTASHMLRVLVENEP